MTKKTCGLHRPIRGIKILFADWDILFSQPGLYLGADSILSASVGCQAAERRKLHCEELVIDMANVCRYNVINGERLPYQ
jgi:hypothetical protein